jgi:DNA-binding XRE family transcriptional regulator
MRIDEQRLYKYIGRLVKAHRQELKVTQDQLAERVGVTRTSITNIEAGSQKLPLYLLFRICAALNLEGADLLPQLSEVVNAEDQETVNIDGLTKQMSPKTATFVRGVLGNLSDGEN